MTEDSQTPEAAPNSRERGPTGGPTPLAGAHAKLWGNYQTLASSFHRETATRDRYEAALRVMREDYRGTLRAIRESLPERPNSAMSRRIADIVAEAMAREAQEGAPPTSAEAAYWHRKYHDLAGRVAAAQEGTP
jgi:hypothetical protein